MSRTRKTTVQYSYFNTTGDHDRQSPPGPFDIYAECTSEAEARREIDLYVPEYNERYPSAYPMSSDDFAVVRREVTEWEVLP